MTTVYHVTSLFQPSEEVNPDQFEARIAIIGRRLERFIRSRLWYLSADQDDFDDAFQGALIRLWKLYQQDPQIMDLDDGWWMITGLRAAQIALKALKAQRSISRSYGVERMEFAASSIERDDGDLDGLEMAERKHARGIAHPWRAESEEADRRIDLERLLEKAVDQIAVHHRQPVRTLLPYIAEGYALKEAARQCGIERSKAEHGWNALRRAACEITSESRQALKGKGTSARTDEYDEIRKLAARGVSLSKIAAQLRRSENFVKVHFEAATGYRRIPNNQRNPITPDRVATMKELRSQGFSMAAIAKSVGCSTSSVCWWLNA